MGNIAASASRFDSLLIDCILYVYIFWIKQNIPNLPEIYLITNGLKEKAYKDKSFCTQFTVIIQRLATLCPTLMFHPA